MVIIAGIVRTRELEKIFKVFTSVVWESLLVLRSARTLSNDTVSFKYLFFPSNINCTNIFILQMTCVVQSQVH